jgi:hypothetical protein
MQARPTLTENTTMDISAFKEKISEVNERLEVSKQELYLKVDVIHKCYQVVDLSLKDIYVKEKKAYSTRSKFQEVIIWKKRANTPGLPLLSHYEQVRGEMALKS